MELHRPRTPVVFDVKYMSLSPEFFSAVSTFADAYPSVLVLRSRPAKDCIHSSDELADLEKLKPVHHCFSSLQLGVELGRASGKFFVLTNRPSFFTDELPKTARATVVAIRRSQEITVDLLRKLVVGTKAYCVPCEEMSPTESGALDMLLAELMRKWTLHSNVPTTVSGLVSMVAEAGNALRPLVSEKMQMLFLTRLLAEGFFYNDVLLRVMQSGTISSIAEAKRLSTVKWTPQLINLLEEAKGEKSKIRQHYSALSEPDKGVVVSLVLDVLRSFVKNFKEKPGHTVVKKQVLRKLLKNKLTGCIPRAELITKTPGLLRDVLDIMCDLLRSKSYVAFTGSRIEYNVSAFAASPAFSLSEKDYQLINEREIREEPELAGKPQETTGKEFQRLVKGATEYLCGWFVAGRCSPSESTASTCELSSLQTELMRQVLAFVSDSVSPAALKSLREDKTTQCLIVGNALHSLQESGYIRVTDNVVQCNCKKSHKRVIAEAKDVCDELGREKEKGATMPKTIAELNTKVKDLVTAHAKRKGGVAAGEGDVERVQSEVLKMLLEAKRIESNRPIVLTKEGAKGHADTQIKFK